MASITSWIRIEPRSRDRDLAPGVEARIHDPLWMIARQWQLGELDGDDSGSAIEARCEVAVGAIDAIRTDGSWHEFDPAATPTSVVAFAGAVGDPTAVPPLGERVRRGRQLLRMLEGSGVPTAPFLGRYPLELTDAESARLDDADRRLFAVMTGRIPDGDVAARELRSVLAGGDLPPALGGAAASPACRAWLEWYDALVDEVAAPAWREDRLAHRFALRAGSLSLIAEHHPAPALHWCDVDAREGDLGSFATQITTAVPTRVRFRGAPARRYWELEDGAVRWPVLDTGPGDVARMLFIEYALTVADDWLLVPIDLPAASVARVITLFVTDTFGVRAEVKAASDLDGAQPKWRFCDTSRDEGMPGPLLVLLDDGAQAARGPTFDAADLARDDLSNTLWGIERVRRGADGRARDVSVAPPASVTATHPTYRLGPPLADAFHPYLARFGADAPVLVRATVPGRTVVAAHPVLPGQVSPDAAPVRPLRVRRFPLLQRANDGSYHVAFTRSVAAAEQAPASPVLLFDRIDPGS